jgi:hypothetical protein
MKETGAMTTGWNDRRLVKRVKPGDGRQLEPFRWWQMTRRSVTTFEQWAHEHLDN